jgi:hypothetical protein
MRTLITSALGYTLALGLVVTAPSEVAAQSSQMTPILRTDIRAATAPNYGCDSWDYSNVNRWWRLTLIPGGSPSGRDALRFEGIRTTEIGNDGWGCRFDASMEPTPRQGSIRYARWRIKYVNPINWRSDASATEGAVPNNRTAPDKLFILGNTCESSAYQPTRVILWQYAEAPSRSQPLLNFTQNIGPGTGFRQVPGNTWLNIQVKIVSSSTESASDGSLHLYVNNNNEGSPTASGTGIRIRTAGWGRNTCASSHVVWGDGSYNPLSAADPTTSNITELADFEYDDQFDPGWAIGSSTSSGPSAPTNLRILSSASLVLLPTGALGLVFVSRRKKA